MALVSRQTAFLDTYVGRKLMYGCTTSLVTLSILELKWHPHHVEDVVMLMLL
jgi:hypothetical protein